MISTECAAIRQRLKITLKMNDSNKSSVLLSGRFQQNMLVYESGGKITLERIDS